MDDFIGDVNSRPIDVEEFLHLVEIAGEALDGRRGSPRSVFDSLPPKTRTSPPRLSKCSATGPGGARESRAGDAGRSGMQAKWLRRGQPARDER